MTKEAIAPGAKAATRSPRPRPVTPSPTAVTSPAQSSPNGPCVRLAKRANVTEAQPRCVHPHLDLAGARGSPASGDQLERAEVSRGVDDGGEPVLPAAGVDGTAVGRLHAAPASAVRRSGSPHARRSRPRPSRRAARRPGPRGPRRRRRRRCGSRGARGAPRPPPGTPTAAAPVRGSACLRRRAYAPRGSPRTDAARCRYRARVRTRSVTRRTRSRARSADSMPTVSIGAGQSMTIRRWSSLRWRPTASAPMSRYDSGTASSADPRAPASASASWSSSSASTSQDPVAWLGGPGGGSSSHSMASSRSRARAAATSRAAEPRWTPSSSTVTAPPSSSSRTSARTPSVPAVWTRASHHAARLGSPSRRSVPTRSGISVTSCRRGWADTVSRQAWSSTGCTRNVPAAARRPAGSPTRPMITSSPGAAPWTASRAAKDGPCRMPWLRRAS